MSNISQKNERKKMRTTLFCMALAATTSVTTMAYSADLDCPEASMVMSETHASARYLTELSIKLGEIELNDKSLRLVADDIRAEFPSVQDAEVADIIIAAYCEYLNTDIPDDQKSDAAVSAFEQATYNAVFGAAPPSDYKRQGWLYGN